MTNVKEFDAARIGNLMWSYMTLRNQLRNLSYKELDQSKDFEALEKIQGDLVRIMIDSDSEGPKYLANNIRLFLKGHDYEAEDVPIYGGLADRRRIQESVYLDGFRGIDN